MAPETLACNCSWQKVDDAKLTCHHIFCRILKSDVPMQETRALPHPNKPEEEDGDPRAPFGRTGDPFHPKAQQLVDRILTSEAVGDVSAIFEPFSAQERTGPPLHVLSRLVIPRDSVREFNVGHRIKTPENAISDWVYRAPDMPAPWRVALKQAPGRAACHVAVFGHSSLGDEPLPTLPSFWRSSPYHHKYCVDLAYPFMFVESRNHIDYFSPVRLSEAQARHNGALSACEMQYLLRRACEDEEFRSTYGADMIQGTLTFSAVVSLGEILLYCHYMDQPSRNMNTESYRTSLCTSYPMYPDTQRKDLADFRQDLLKIMRWAKGERAELILRAAEACRKADLDKQVKVESEE